MKSSKIQTEPTSKKVFIVEDHKVFREGLVQILKNEPDLAVAGQAGSVEQAFPSIMRLQPDLVLVDITLPGKSGLDLIKQVRAVNRKIKMLVVSNHDEAYYADRVIRSGGDGYIMKQEDPEEIICAIRDVLEGRIYVSEDVMEAREQAAAATANAKKSAPTEARPLDQLTDVELEVLELFGRGKTSSEIARQLGSNLKTIVAHATRIKNKLKLKTVNALIRYAVCWVETEAR